MHTILGQYIEEWVIWTVLIYKEDICSISKNLKHYMYYWVKLGK